MEQKQSCAFRTTIGGQALIEGILMRGPDKQAIVVRSKEGLVTKVEDRKLAGPSSGAAPCSWALSSRASRR